jgi:hypothetical protein
MFELCRRGRFELKDEKEEDEEDDKKEIKEKR